MHITIKKRIQIQVSRTWVCGEGCCSETEREYEDFFPSVLPVSPYYSEGVEIDRPPHLGEDSYHAPFVISLDHLRDLIEEGDGELEVSDDLQRLLDQ